MRASGETTPPRAPSRLDLLPARLLPALYFGLAHAALVTAFAVVALDPNGAAGFFEQPRTIAVVHLVTLGWISASILGALYVVGPMALRTPMPVRARDYVAFALFGVGTSGMIAHFFIAEYSGVAWSAGLVLAGLLLVGGRTAAALRRAPIPTAVKLHVVLAFLNVAGAGTLGLLLALHKTRPFLPGPPLSNLFAHVHLAALGWAGMMVIGVAYRMLPMILPAAMPAGRPLLWSALLLEAGVLGLAGGFLLETRLLLPSALLVIGAFATFLLQVGRMLRNRRRRPSWLLLPDYGALHALQSILYAVLAAGLGIVLIVSSQETALRLAPAYGVLGIAGFLAQMVLGVQTRILPMLAAYHANLGAACDAPPASPRDMGSNAVRAIVFVLWSAGVPLLAVGLMRGSGAVVGAAAWALLAGALLGAANAAAVLRHAYGRRPLPASLARAGPLRPAAPGESAQEKRRR